VFCVYDGTKLVGVTTCIPLADETPDVKDPFVKANEPIDHIFYFGESILLSPYRGLGLGHRFFDEREAHARSFGTYQTTCFCAVERPKNHPMQPIGYQPLNIFWQKRGYVLQSHLQSQFEWQDIGEDSLTYKTMNYWSSEIG
jgi:GNAT superfamily N-acetyltransferase